MVCGPRVVEVLLKVWYREFVQGGVFLFLERKGHFSVATPVLFYFYFFLGGGT